MGEIIENNSGKHGKCVKTTPLTNQTIYHTIPHEKIHILFLLSFGYHQHWKLTEITLCR
jgi:hypothetical protein